MIVTIESSIPTFKSVLFHEGLNVLLADTVPDATSKQTRNSAGKTSLIEIIHFLLGSKCDAESLFRTDALREHSFTATLDIGISRLRVQRSGAEPSKIFILEGMDKKEVPLKIDKATGRQYISNANWCAFLGQEMFGLHENDGSFTPTFRSIFSYFARRRKSGGFNHPERSSEMQQRWDWQVNLSYLFGLDWRLPFELSKVRDREKMLEELKKASKGGAFGSIVGSVAELRPQVAVAETKAKKLRDQLGNFEILDSYKDLTRRAARSRSEMQTIGRSMVNYQETLNHLEKAIQSEAPPDKTDLQKLYAAAGIELPGVALKRFEEVSKFYESVVSNRQSHLEREIVETKQKIVACENELDNLDRARSDILRTLEGKGALEDFVALQRELAELEASSASLKERYKAAELLEGESTQLDLDRMNIKQRLQADHQARKAVLDEAILVIADAIHELYDDRSGGFVVDATKNGPEFRINIEGDRGGGISNIEVYCLDLALLKLVSQRMSGTGFLIHDSHLFDGVDERQIACALLLGQEATLGCGLQYIVTMNSDIFDRLPLSDKIDRSKVVLPTRLSDKTKTGGLFGFWFD